jgi:hypothetical protein
MVRLKNKLRIQNSSRNFFCRELGQSSNGVDEASSIAFYYPIEVCKMLVILSIQHTLI